MTPDQRDKLDASHDCKPAQLYEVGGCCFCCGYEMSAFQWKNHTSCPKCGTPTHIPSVGDCPECKDNG